MKMLGGIFAIWGFYAAVSAYIAGDIVATILLLVVSIFSLLTSITSGRSVKVYTALLCIRDEDSIFQFPVGVASTIAQAGLLIKIEALARQKKEVEEEAFTTSDDYYIIQERELNSAQVLQEFSFTSRGDYISE